MVAESVPNLAEKSFSNGNEKELLGRVEETTIANIDDVDVDVNVVADSDADAASSKLTFDVTSRPARKSSPETISTRYKTTIFFLYACSCQLSLNGYVQLLSRPKPVSSRIAE